jgi:hypothetical protein
VSYGTRDWIREGEKKLRVVTEQYERCLRVQDDISRLRRTLRERLPAGMENFLDQLLSEGVLTTEGVRNAARQVECTSLYYFDPLEEIAKAEGELKAEIAEIEAGENFARIKTEFPGLLADFDAKKEEMGNPQRFLRISYHERLVTLLENGYGTEDYSTPWWRLSYYSDWEAGDEILEAHGERYEEFGAFAEVYRERSNLVQRLEGELETLEAEVDLLRTLDQQHFAVGQQLASVPKHVAERVRGALESHIAEGGMGILKGVEAGAKGAACEWVGVGKQLGYLDDLAHKMITPFAVRMKRDQSKLVRKVAKYRRPKHRRTTFSDAEFERTFTDRSAKYVKFWKRFDQAFAAIRDFVRYEYGAFEDDFLWWDLIGEGRVRNRFSPEVEEFYEEYPDYSWDSPWEEDDDEAYAAAAVAGADDEGMDWDAS